MTEELRMLLYPFGFMATFFFMLRFFIQWGLSERKRKSHVTKLFWQLSLAGNILLMIHAFIQVQFHLGLVQATSVVISWRNINLMSDKKPPASFSSVIALFLFSIIATCAVFMIQAHYSSGTMAWIQAPRTPWHSPVSVGMAWHTIGSIGMFLFASRFFVQWWQSERARKSVLNASFWYLSIFGALLAAAYFIVLGDIINILGYSAGLVPYLRNLMLLKKEKRRIDYAQE